MAAAQAAGAASRRIAYYPINDTDALMAVGCEHGDDSALRRLCGAVLRWSSHEFFSAFAYDVVDCVRAHGEVVQLETGAGASGLVTDPHPLVAMNGRLGRTEIELRAREGGGFVLQFNRPRAT